MKKNREEILEELHRTQFVENFTKKFVRQNDIDYIEDEIQDIWIIICELPQEKLQALYRNGGINGVRRFVSGIIHRQMNSVTSKIHATYRKRIGTTYSTANMTNEELEKGKNKLENEYK